MGEVPLQERVALLLVKSGQFNKEHCYVQDTGLRCGACRGSPFVTRCFRSERGERWHRPYVNGHRGTGRPGGPRNTKRRLDPATRSSDEQYNRKRQSQPFTKKLATASQCDSKKCAGPTEIITLESKPRDRKPRPMEGPRGGAKSASGLEVWCFRRLETERIYGLAGAQITHSHVPLTCYELVSSERET